METHRRTRNVAALTLIVALAALAIDLTAIASAGPASEAGSDSSGSPWPEPTEVVTSGNTPSLSNDVGMPPNGGGAELPIGLGLSGLALFLLLSTLAKTSNHRSARHRRGEDRVTRLSVRQPKLETQQRR